jgi:hypothetical protein
VVPTSTSVLFLLELLELLLELLEPIFAEGSPSFCDQLSTKVSG